MAGNRNAVLLTVADPDYVIPGALDELFAVSRISSNKVLIVIYKESVDDGFILTAFFTSKIEKLLKRKILWRK